MGERSVLSMKRRGNAASAARTGNRKLRGTDAPTPRGTLRGAVRGFWFTRDAASRDDWFVKTSPRLPVALLGLLLSAGCSKPDAPAPGASSQAAAKHEHKAPHNGTPVVLGHEAYHLELVRDAATGALSAYVLDGEMENFIRVKAPSFEVTATVAGEKRTLAFRAVANPVTGETVGDTSQFDAQADWLKTTGTFDAVLATLEIRGTPFANVAFNFPKGNDKD